MKYWFGLFFFFCSLPNSFTQQSSLTIEVLGIETLGGIIQVGIYNNSDDFPSVGKEYQIAYTQVSSKQTKVVVDNLNHGDYALALYHDLNSDGVCNLNFISIPLEPYAFSNNFRPIFKKPSFEQTKFTLDADRTIQIELIH